MPTKPPTGAENASQLGDSMLSEGRSMLVAIATDFARVPQCNVVVTWSADLPRLELPGVQIKLVSSADEERLLLKQLAAECDAAFIIAPETDGILAERRRLVDEAGGRFLGCSLQAIELCTDKLRLFEHLTECGISTIETAACETISEIPLGRFPIVVKPRDGAGSQDTFLLNGREDLDALCASNGLLLNRAIWQPYVPGRPISLAAIVSPTTQQTELFPVSEQRLTPDGRPPIGGLGRTRRPTAYSVDADPICRRRHKTAMPFQYLGGTIPAQGVSPESVGAVVGRTIESIPGLSGYVGFDLVVSSEDADDVRLVEINPRLTTSYLGYRAMTDDNLAARLLLDKPQVDVIDWKDQTAEFDANGAVRVYSSA